MESKVSNNFNIKIIEDGEPNEFILNKKSRNDSLKGSSGNPKSDNTSKMTYTYHSDEITDLSFSSENPYLFASCDSAGLLCLNTLYNDQEEPLFKTKLDFPLFNAKWDNSGKMLALSDDSGRIHLKRFRSGFFHYTQEKLSLLERILKK